MYNIENLSQLTGFSRRAIRFYIQRGVLDPPEGAGRGSFYTDEHADKLRQIKKLSEQGVPVARMRKVLEGAIAFSPREPDTDIVPQPWERLCVSDGIELSFQPGKLTVKELVKIKGYILNLIRED